MLALTFTFISIAINQLQSAAVLLTTCAAVPCISCQCSPLPLQLKNRFSSENLPKQGFLPSTCDLSDLILHHDWQGSPKPPSHSPCSGIKTFLCDKQKAWEPIWAPDPQHQQRASEPSNQKGRSIQSFHLCLGCCQQEQGSHLRLS